MIQKLVEDRVAQGTFTNEQLPALTKELADKSKNALKSLEMDKRYKFIVQVICGQNTGYGIRMGSRQFWDNTKDDVAYVTVQKENFYVTVCAFAIYLY